MLSPDNARPWKPIERGERMGSNALRYGDVLPADARFMQDMIPHEQALEMAALAGERTNRPEIVDQAGRIESSQQDEIELMQEWLAERGERMPDSGGSCRPIGFSDTR